MSKDVIVKLRETTGAGMMDCKKALTDAKGDYEQARKILKEKGLDFAKKKAGRETKDGQVISYIHGGGKIGVLVEINCETDFVARNEIFQRFAKDLAMQIAAETEDAPLLDQKFIKDPSKNIREYLNETIARLGENVIIRRYARFALGEEPATEELPRE